MIQLFLSSLPLEPAGFCVLLLHPAMKKPFSKLLCYHLKLRRIIYCETSARLSTRWVWLGCCCWEPEGSLPDEDAELKGNWEETCTPLRRLETFSTKGVMMRDRSKIRWTLERLCAFRIWQGYISLLFWLPDSIVFICALLKCIKRTSQTWAFVLDDWTIAVCHKLLWDSRPAGSCSQLSLTHLWSWWMEGEKSPLCGWLLCFLGTCRWCSDMPHSQHTLNYGQMKEF